MKLDMMNALNAVLQDSLLKTCLLCTSALFGISSQMSAGHGGPIGTFLHLKLMKLCDL